MNIVLVIFDSLRKDCVNVYGAPPWGKIRTPNFLKFSQESLTFDRVYPESLPTLPARRAIYTGRRCYPFENGDIKYKGDFTAAPGWGPIPEDQPTLSELLQDAGYRTALVSDVYHQFKPSKNFWRGFDQWTFLRGQEVDHYRSGPHLTKEQINYWLPKKQQSAGKSGPNPADFIHQCMMNYHDRVKEEDFFAPRVLKEAALWLEQNQDADNFFLTVESFDPHEPWYAPESYRKLYVKKPGQEQIISWYRDVETDEWDLIERTRMNYYAEVDMCDHWFGYFMERMRALNMLDNTMVILTADHGHSIGDGGYLGKRGYPSSPDVVDIPLMIRFPGAKYAGKRSSNIVQHHDYFAGILEMLKVKAPPKMDGKPFIMEAATGKKGGRDHATIGWGSTITVVTDRWWFNCKADGTGPFLYDLSSAKPFKKNVASKNKNIVNTLFAKAIADAGGSIPEWIVDLAKNQTDAPGCSALAARA